MSSNCSRVGVYGRRCELHSSAVRLQTKGRGGMKAMKRAALCVPIALVFVVGPGTRGIYVQTLDRGDRSVLVKVGACAQWRGYRPGALYLTSSVPQDVSSIRLLR